MDLHHSSTLTPLQQQQRQQQQQQQQQLHFITMSGHDKTKPLNTKLIQVLENQMIELRTRKGEGIRDGRGDERLHYTERSASHRIFNSHQEVFFLLTSQN